jgi:hypothetical protein
LREERIGKKRQEILRGLSPAQDDTMYDSRRSPGRKTGVGMTWEWEGIPEK